MKFTRRVLTLILGFTTLILICVQSQLSDAQPVQLPNFVGRYIATLSDGDFLASTYADGKLPDSINPDRLSIIQLPLDERAAIAQVEASNSVTGAPYAFDLTANGQTAFVVETLAAPPIGATQRDQLPPGQQLVMIDLSDSRRPRVESVVAIAPKPETVSVHPGGALLTISTQTPGREILLIPIQNEVFGQPIEFSLSQLGIQPDPDRFQDGMYVSSVQWHPSGRYLAVNLTYRDQIAFYELRQDQSGNPQLIPWGTPVNVGKDPFTGQFTPDGRFYLTSNWGRNFGENITTLEQRIPSAQGTVSVIQLALDNAQHQVVSTATSDLSPESLAISPDGSLVVTVNMRGTLFPPLSPRFTREASLSLLKLEQSGQLTKVGDYPFEGILPESAAFDASGNYLAVAVYDYFTSKPEAGIELWQVIRSPELGLRHTRQVIEVDRGAHQVMIAP
ncbi:MAG: lactonase family protein [Drouetiella hepatica Uher 2000/2452]|uniref:Lactonase family protein n=1 Tax=Drouetiella hepatica Uher 2000/2452 TaxID=904376 RepID=A0A951Q813_9CYAN|nr:lactonase family protein [Drouetiella hepatica Uher 2000/2452]